jgi:hypothetical protein
MNKSIDPQKFHAKNGPVKSTSVFSKEGRHHVHGRADNGHSFSAVYATEEAAHEAARQLRGAKAKQSGNRSGKLHRPNV